MGLGDWKEGELSVDPRRLTGTLMNRRAVGARLVFTIFIFNECVDWAVGADVVGDGGGGGASGLGDCGGW